ncbi:pyrimidine operon attenuation protein/uracil phosphoribosyltransferase [Neolewinella xylanilytica]|uniref:Pyrimidine operon attenuation protein/uracil phosphoribosyltransferase n=1 Tax=Neolewinella xylanilytica TaxID=1514080 RepID=A0A2S6I4J3_9BACT|nr:phosphoribosyltransferase family protein [Neolewinella xylanilytica]PPK86078.1 pyrimidine operon attenuation protein/uracil phosphoribosyltransferase [Neolewinella xylanilytica]
MQLLTHRQIDAKVTRLAMEILEHNTAETELYILGVNNRGMELARRLAGGLRTLSQSPLHLWNLRIDPRKPLDGATIPDHDVQELNGKPVLVVDDVANTGRTLFYALGALRDVLPGKIEVAVLVDRQHKEWPIYVTYSGLVLSTTLGDNILVEFGEEDAALLQ